MGTPTLNLFFRPKDSDNDLVPDAFDSQPHNPKKQSNPITQIPPSLRPPQKFPSQLETKTSTSSKPSLKQIQQIQQKQLTKVKQQNLNKANKQIEYYKNRVEHLRKKIGIARNQGQYDRAQQFKKLLDNSKIFLENWKANKSLIDKGYSFESVKKRVRYKSTRSIQRPELMKIQRQKYQKAVEQYKQNVKKELRGTGLRPIFRNGQLAGIEDTRTKMSIPVKNLKSYLPERQKYIPSKTSLSSLSKKDYLKLLNRAYAGDKNAQNKLKYSYVKSSEKPEYRDWITAPKRYFEDFQETDFYKGMGSMFSDIYGKFTAPFKKDDYGKTSQDHFKEGVKIFTEDVITDPVRETYEGSKDIYKDTASKINYGDFQTGIKTFSKDIVTDPARETYKGVSKGLKVFDLPTAYEGGVEMVEDIGGKLKPEMNFGDNPALDFSGVKTMFSDIYGKFTDPFPNVQKGVRTTLNIPGDISRAKQREKEVFEPAGKEVMELIEQAKNKNEKDIIEVHKKLYSYGVKPIKRYNPITKTIYYEYEYPEWFKQLRTDFQTRETQEMFIPFFLRKFRYGISEATSQIFHRGVYKGATIFQPSIDVSLTPLSKKVGEGFGIGAEMSSLLIPGIAPVVFLGGTAEATARGKLIPYTKKHPFEVGFAGLYGIAKGYQAVKYLRSPTIATETLIPFKNMTPSRVGAVSKPLKRKKITTPKGERIITEQFNFFGTGGYYRPGQKTVLSTKFRDLFGLKPVYKGIPYTQKTAYQKALKKLIKHGYTQSQAKRILRYRQPKMVIQTITGEAKAVYKKDKTIMKLLGVEAEKPLKFPGLRGGKEKVRYIYSKGKPVEKFEGTISNVIVQTPSKKPGKQYERFKELTDLKKIGEKDLGYDDFFFGERVDIFKDKSITKRLIPLKRKLDVSDTGTLIIGKGKPDYILEYDSPFKIYKDKIKGVAQKTKGKQNILSQQEQAKNVLSSIAIPTTTTTTKIKPSVITTDLSKLKIRHSTMPIIRPVVTTEQKHKTILKTGFEVKEKPKEKIETKIKTIERQKPKIKTGYANVLNTANLTKTSYGFKDYQETAPSLKLNSVQKQAYKQKQKTQTGFSIINTPLSFYSEKTKPKPELKTFGFIPPAPSDDHIRRSRKGYHVLIRKSGKFQKVTNKPFGFEASRDIGSKYVDTTLSRTFKLQPVMVTKIIKGKPKEIPKMFGFRELEKSPFPNYYERNKKELRDYQIQRGRKKPLIKTWIEKVNYALDSVGEKTDIKRERIRAKTQKMTGNRIFSGLNYNRTRSSKKRKRRFTI